MILSPNTYIIVIHHKKIAVAAWLGICNNNTLYYLYGGATERGFELNAQYLIQLCAFKLAARLKAQYYDLGGYDPDKGYGTFKECFHGEILNFPG